MPTTAKAGGERRKAEAETEAAAGAGALRVAVLGGGPAGSTLAALLAQRGMDVAVFDDAGRPGLVVGESLVPALVPILRRLGIEQRVAAIGVRKPGVSFLLAGHARPLDLSFEPVGDHLPRYAYNIPRPAFDDLLRERAREGGAAVVPGKAGVERDPAHREGVRLAADALARVPAWEGRQPDFIADCTGRRRALARLLDLPARDGDRRDVALFAHFENFSLTGIEPGQVVTGILREGWSWCIPLRGKVSVGVVVHRAHLRQYGRTPEDQLMGVLRADPHLRVRVADAARVSDVLSYTNYQKIGERGHGPNWALVGDALGFVDPMFSPGLFLAMRSAELLADTLGKRCPGGKAPRSRSPPRFGPRGLSPGRAPISPLARPGFQKALGRYDREMRGWFESWSRLIDVIYRGQVLAMREAGMQWLEAHPGRLSRWLGAHMERQMASMAAGGATRSRYAWFLLRMGLRYGMRGQDPARYRVK